MYTTLVGAPDYYISTEVNDAPKLEEAYGLWKTTVHPPFQLKIPVLGQRINGKYVFHLCTKCAESEIQNPCVHSKEERSIKGTFFTGELQAALSKGYEIETPVEVWDWPRPRRTTKMFRKFMREFFARKALASGLSEVPSERETYLNDLKATLKLRLDPNDFKKDSTLRSLAKYACNNLWGYLGRRGDESQTIFCREEKEIYKIVNDAKLDVTSMRVVAGGKFLRLDYKPKKEQVVRTASIVLALITTSFARLELFRLLDEYSEEVVYFDTDSAVLLLPADRPGPPTSASLGGLKDEITEKFGPGHRISSFTSLGPKCYVFTVVDETGKLVHTEQKVKGISLSTKAMEVVNEGLMDRLVESRADGVRVPQFRVYFHTLNFVSELFILLNCHPQACGLSACLGDSISSGCKFFLMVQEIPSVSKRGFSLV